MPFPEPQAERSETCLTCGADLQPEDDFCLECGHSVTWRSGNVDRGAEDEEDKTLPCPRCGEAMRVLSYGHPQCEVCGYMERH